MTRPSTRGALKAAGVAGGALLVLAGIIAVSAGYHHHSRYRACRAELLEAVGNGKTLAQFAADRRPDGLFRRFSSDERTSLREVAGAWTQRPETLAEIETKAARASASAAFLFGDMVYVLFFDDRDRLTQFVCLGN